MRIQRTSLSAKNEENDKEEEFECLLNRQREQAKIIKAAQQRFEQAEEELKNAQQDLDVAKRVQMEICLQVQHFSWTDNNNKNDTILIHKQNNNSNNNGESRNSLQSSSHTFYSNNNNNNTIEPEPVSPNLNLNPRSRKNRVLIKTKKGCTTTHNSNRLKRVPKRRQIILETEAEFNKYIQRIVEETNDENIDGLYDKVFVGNRIRYMCRIIHPGTKQKCGTVRDSPCWIREHIKQRSGIRPFKCKICPDVRCFRTKWEASRHVRHNVKHKQRVFNLSLSTTKDETENSLSPDSQLLRNVPQKNSKRRRGRKPNTVIRRGNRIIDPVSKEFNKYIERLNDKIDYKAHYSCTEDETGRKRYICQARHGSRRKYGKECGLIGLTPLFIINHLKQKMKVPLFQCKICPDIKPFSSKVLANRHLRHSVGHAKKVYDIEANEDYTTHQNSTVHDSFNGEGLETETSIANEDNSNDADELILSTTENGGMDISDIDISLQSENESQSSIIRINRNLNKVKLESDFRSFEIKMEPESQFEHPLEYDTQISEEPLPSEIQPQQQQQQQQLDNASSSSGSGNHRNHRSRRWSCELCNIYWRSEISLKRHNIKYHQVRYGRKRKRVKMEMEQTDEALSCSFCDHHSNSIEAQAIHTNTRHKIPRVVLPKLLLTNLVV